MSQSKPKKVSLDQILQLVERLPAGEREQLRQRLNRSTNKENTLANSESHTFFDWRINLDELAAQQGVPAGNCIEDLKGNFWPPDEDLDEFIATVREWRKESQERP